MNLHISPDEKFLDAFIRNCERFTDVSNRFLVIAPTGKPEFVRSRAAVPVLPDADEIRSVAGDLDQYECVFLHFMTPVQARIVNEAPESVRFAWVFYGAEAFSFPQFRRTLLGRRTMGYASRTNYFADFRLSSRPALLRRNVWNSVLHRRERSIVAKAMQRVDYLCHFIEEDYDWLRSVMGIRASFVSFNYNAFEDITVGCDQVEDPRQRHNVLLGNSASIYNNHLELIEALSGFDLSGRLVIMPLSYAGHAFYADYVADVASRRLGSGCRVLKQFVQRDEYNQLLESCGVFLMNQYRSQAAGTNQVSFASGASLFISERSTLSRFYKRLGLKVFSIEHDLSAALAVGLPPLGRADAEANRSIAKAFFGESAVGDRYRSMFATVAAPRSARADF